MARLETQGMAVLGAVGRAYHYIEVNSDNLKPKTD